MPSGRWWAPLIPPARHGGRVGQFGSRDEPVGDRMADQDDGAVPALATDGLDAHTIGHALGVDDVPRENLAWCKRRRGLERIRRPRQP